MTNIEKNLKPIEQKHNITLTKNLKIIEENSSITLINNGKLTRLFPNSNYNIQIHESYVSVNDVFLLDIPRRITNINERNELLLSVSRAIYDITG